MKKLIKLEFNNTTRERKTEDSYSELYSYDKNNGSFEFEILNDTLTTEQVTALFKFTDSNKIWKTTGTVEGNKVNVTFDTSLITQNETVICYLYIDEEQRTSDTFRFKFKVKVSEIDKMSRYEVKERFINNTVIVDRLDVVTKEELKEALKNVGGIATEGLLTEVKAEELYAKKSEAVDNTNFELVKNRVLALELKTDKDTVYDDSELKGRISVLEAREDNNTIYDDTSVRERLTALESKPNVDISNLATKEELNEVRNSQPTVDTLNLVTRDELTAKNYLTEHQSLDNLVTKQELEEKHYLTSHQDLSEYAKKTELYNDTDLKSRVTALESKAIEGGAYDDKPIRDRLDVLEAKHDNDTIYDDTEVKRRLTELESKPTVDTSVFVTDEKLNSKGYLTEHQDLSNYALKSEIPTPYNDTPLNERITALENRPTTGGSVDTTNLVTKAELKEKEDDIYDAINRNPLFEVYAEETAKEHLDNSSSFANENIDSRGGIIYSNASHTTADIFKGDVAKEKFVDFNTAMFTVANSIPDNYHLYDLMYAGGVDKKVIFLSNKNFSEVVPKEELKAIIREAGVSTGGSVDTSNLATKEELAKAVTKEELASKNYLTQHQPLDNLVTKEELNNKGYVTDEVLNSKGYLTQHQPLTDYALKSELYNDTEVKDRLTNLENKPNIDTSSFVTNEQLEAKHYLTEHQPLTHLATTSDLEVLRNISVNKAELSKKVDLTEYNSFKDSVVSKSELADKGYLTQHQDLSEYALKSELYNDTPLKSRVDAIEYDMHKVMDLENSVNSLKNRVWEVENKLREYDGIDSIYATKDELRVKDDEFNFKFVLKDNLRSLVSEIITELKSENN